LPAVTAALLTVTAKPEPCEGDRKDRAGACDGDRRRVEDGVIGRGVKVFSAAPVRGEWRRLEDPDDVLELMDTSAEGVVACVVDAGATFLAPIFDDLTAVVCLSGTPVSHIGIVSREYQIPCIMAATLDAEPKDGDTVVVDCSGDDGVVRATSS
jgi:phosphohistidine swiveling domain-containing protein